MTQTVSTYEIGSRQSAQESGGGELLRLRDGIGLGDLSVRKSDDGQYLLIHCGDELLVMYGAMGSSVGVIEFADGRRCSVEDVLDGIVDTRGESDEE